MSEYYKANRTKNLYDPKNDQAFKISRSKLENFMNCSRCFYIDRRLGVGTPPGFPFNLNSAVDTLLKKEFDIFRKEGKKHPLIEKYGVDARPVSHEELDKWRENFVGIQYLHPETNFLITGAIDDLWINSKGEYIVVDYKSTSKNGDIVALDQAWQSGYKRQMEIYQWLLRKNGLKVSDTGYFVYCNGVTDCDKFDNKLDFEISLIAYDGDDSWVEDTIIEAHKCLCSDKIPSANPECDYCNYVSAVSVISNTNSTTK
ncbi:MAG: PD-(D/E)XK nuclease family protein [Candidatus Berkelbacteria bacterium]|nr:PD-(D/E)XK nuclease family protein [Candidatus Berkelbacteria bacterium]